ncbi:MAG: PHB depolymerase family esterase [Burkholderiaceae bacterium]|nr:PHB depolymerase family esterase [Burkholderiaceae bacterium]
MARRISGTAWNKALMRAWSNTAKAAARAGTKAVAKALKNAPAAVKAKPAAPRNATKADWSSGAAFGVTGVRRYRLYKPPGLYYSERLPLVVMLHGCGQNAEAFAHCTRMNRLAASQRFLVLYPEQDRTANAQNCWNWFDTRTGRARREAESIDAAIDHVCLLYPVDRDRIVLAGLSAGASMAALMATQRPARYRAIAMHSGVPPGSAHSSASAMAAMRGRRIAELPPPTGAKLPPLLVIHGQADHVVAPLNGKQAAQSWASREDARPCPPRIIRRGSRYPATITDYRVRGRVAVTLCEVHGLGHTWSGGAAGQAYSDTKGPDACAMIWSFAKRQFAPAA